jgi:hypothetical protein
MVQLRIKEVAQAQQWNLSRFQRAADLPMSTARRYWHSSKTGLARDSGTLQAVGLEELSRIARILNVPVYELLAEDKT